MYKIGIDIGATNTKFVLISKSKIIKKEKISTPKNKEKLIKILEQNIENLISGIPLSRIRGIGIGVPGPLNKKRDFILNPPNLKCLSNCPLSKIIKKDLKIKTIMENDVSCFTLAEAKMGAGKGAEIVAGITLGTGVGGGLAIKNKIYQGAFGSASEFGHMTIKFNGKNFSSLEDYCSEKFFKEKGFIQKN